MFARLMGLKTISPHDLHRSMQDQLMSAGISGWLRAGLPTDSGDPRGQTSTVATGRA